MKTTSFIGTTCVFLTGMVLLSAPTWAVASYLQVNAGAYEYSGGSEINQDTSDTQGILHTDYCGHNITASADSRLCDSQSIGVMGSVTDGYDSANVGDYNWTGSFSANGQQTITLSPNSLGWLEVPVSIHASISVADIDQNITADSDVIFGVSVSRNSHSSYGLASWGGRLSLVNNNSTEGATIDWGHSDLPSDDSVSYTLNGGTLLLQGSTTLHIPIEYIDNTYTIHSNLEVAGNANSMVDGLSITTAVDAYNSLGFGDGDDYFWDVLTGTAQVYDVDNPDRVHVPEPATLSLLTLLGFAALCHRTTLRRFSTRR